MLDLFRNVLMQGGRDQSVRPRRNTKTTNPIHSVVTVVFINIHAFIYYLKRIKLNHSVSFIHKTLNVPWLEFKTETTGNSAGGELGVLLVLPVLPVLPVLLVLLVPRSKGTCVVEVVLTREGRTRALVHLSWLLPGRLE